MGFALYDGTWEWGHWCTFDNKLGTFTLYQCVRLSADRKNACINPYIAR